MENLELELFIFITIFIRIICFFVTAPLFGRKNTPIIIKIGFSLLLTELLRSIMEKSVFNEQFIKVQANMYYFVLIIFKETILGLMLGFISYAIFTSIYFAGQLIDTEIGFGMVAEIDPLSNIQTPVSSNLYFIIAMVTFLTFKGHHVLIKTLFESFKSIPPGNAVFKDSLIDNLISIFGSVFIMGFKIAAPITVSILITDISLGIISRAIPQFNVFIVGMPLKIAVGIGIMILSIPILIELLTKMFSEISNETQIFIEGMIIE